MLHDSSVAKRLWSGALADGTGCWVWQRSKRDGYGQMWVGGTTVGTHRLAYEIVKGPIPKGLEIDHLCRNRRCINPDHLEAVTGRENILRGEGAPAQNARKTHCKRGHLFDEANTNIATGERAGERNCRECKRVTNAARYEA